MSFLCEEANMLKILKNYFFSSFQTFMFLANMLFHDYGADVAMYVRFCVCIFCFLFAAFKFTKEFCVIWKLIIIFFIF